MTAPTPILPGVSIREIEGADGAALVVTSATGTVSVYLSREDWRALGEATGVLVRTLGAGQGQDRAVPVLEMERWRL